MLVLLHFHELGYTPVQLAFLFLLYEFFGIVTNLVGGWLAARAGVRLTLVLGMALQIGALLMLTFLATRWSRVMSVSYVMACQALSGIAKDLTKMSAKSAVRTLVRSEDQTGLFNWVAVLTGSLLRRARYARYSGNPRLGRAWPEPWDSCLRAPLL